MDEQHPGPMPFKAVAHLPAEVEGVYNQAQRSYSAEIYLGVALICRGLLMHVAVDRLQVAEGLAFTAYVDALVQRYYPQGNTWIDRVRRIGNRGTHDIDPVQKEDATAALQLPRHRRRRERLLHPCSTASSRPESSRHSSTPLDIPGVIRRSTRNSCSSGKSRTRPPTWRIARPRVQFPCASAKNLVTRLTTAPSAHVLR